MEQIISKAIEGGYEDREKDVGFSHTPLSYRWTVCDPLFWQALSKACKWEDLVEERLGWMTRGPKVTHGWKYHALRFHEINLTEGWDKAVSYLQELVK